MGLNQEQKLEAELKKLQEARSSDTRIKNLKKQIKAEKFSQTKTGKVFNVVGRVGQKVLSPTPKQVRQAGKRGSKKIKKNVKTVKDVMKEMDKAVGQFNY